MAWPSKEEVSSDRIHSALCDSPKLCIFLCQQATAAGRCVDDLHGCAGAGPNSGSAWSGLRSQ
jgi:hypothetical protein